MIESGTLDGRPCTYRIEGDGSQPGNIVIMQTMPVSEAEEMISRAAYQMLTTEAGVALTVLLTSHEVITVDTTSLWNSRSNNITAHLESKAHMIRHLSELPNDWPGPPKPPPPVYW